MSHRFRGFGVVVVVAAGFLAGCGGGSHSSSPTTSGSPTTAVSPTSAGSATTSPQTTSTVPGVGRCRTAQVKADFNVQPPVANQPATQTRVLITLTNTSASSCTVYGYAGIGASVGGSTQSIHVNRVNQPGRPVLVTLKAQTTAFAGAAWTSGSSCTSVANFVLTPPNETTTVPVSLTQPAASNRAVSICTNAGIALGPFEPTAQGVVAFPVTTTPPGVTACVSADLSATFAVIPGSAGAGNVVARIVLTNKSAAPCSTGGYVGLQLLGAGGTQLPTHVERASGSLSVMTVAPGTSVSATARYSPDVAGTGDNQSGMCQPVASSSEVTPPNDTAFVIAQGPGTSVCQQGTMSVSPLQVGSQAGAA